MNCTVTVYQDSQGRQVLVRRWDDGTQEVATREEPFGSWGPPLSEVRTERERTAPEDFVRHLVSEARRQGRIP